MRVARQANTGRLPIALARPALLSGCRAFPVSPLEGSVARYEYACLKPTRTTCDNLPLIIGGTSVASGSTFAVIDLALGAPPIS
jgi:hypothetical protein